MASSCATVMCSGGVGANACADHDRMRPTFAGDGDTREIQWEQSYLVWSRRVLAGNGFGLPAVGSIHLLASSLALRAQYSLPDGPAGSRPPFS